MKSFLSVFISAVLIISVSGVSFSQEDAAKKVSLVRVKDNKAISTAVILSKVKTKMGSTFSQDVLNDDLRRLYALGFFTDISIDVSDHKEGLAVTFIVTEKPLIKRIDIQGNIRIKKDLITKGMQSKEGKMFDPGRLPQDIEAIKDLYEKKGFHLADIDYSSQVDENENAAVVTVIINEDVAVKIKHIFIDGNESYHDKILMRLMTTRPDALFSSGYFKKSVFDEDLEKIKAFYQREGFLDVSVESDTEYYDENKRMDITILLNEGKRYLVGDISMDGNKVFTHDQLKDVLDMTRFKPFSQEGMKLDAIHVQEIYYKNGYIMCRVFPEAAVNDRTGEIDIAYAIDENSLIYVNKIEIKGNTKTKDVVIRRQLRAYPGEPFNGDNIKRSKEKLYNLGYFEEIAFDTRETGDPAKRDLVVNVKETKTGEFSFGGGYSSIDKLIGFASVSQKNFDIVNFPTFTGGGQTLTLRGELGFVRSNYFLGWSDPWIFGFPYSYGFDLYRTTHERERDVGYGWEEERWGGSTRIGKEFTDWLRGGIFYRLDRVKITDMPQDIAFDVRREEGSNYLSSLGSSLTFDTRDNVFNPTRGIYATAGVEDAGGIFFGDFDFLKYTGKISKYFGFVENNLVLELKTRVGVAHEYGDSDHVPIYERFYAGGSGTIRGYSERGVGPRDIITGDAIGGESLLVGNAELVFPVYKGLIKGAVFYDIGNVWDEADDLGQGSYKHGTGAGVRVKTPIGPVKIDWGYPLEEISHEEQKGRFYFSVSHGF